MCKRNSVRIGVDSGGSYLGESVRCANVRLMEHIASLTKRAHSNIKEHVQMCGCSFDPTTSKLLAGPNIKGLYPRRLCEAIVTAEFDEPQKIINQTTITPSRCEIMETFCSHIFLTE